MSIIIFVMLVGVLVYIHYLSGRIDRIEQRQNDSVSLPTTKTNSARASSVSALKAPSAKASVPIEPFVESEPFDSTKFINLLPKIGVVALVIGLAFFLKYAIDQGWVSVNFRLFIGASTGSLFLLLFYLWREKYSKYALVLAGGGLAIWYLTIFSAVQLYSVMSTNGGLVVLIVVNLIGLLLAYKTKSKALAAMAWGGAYLAPMVLGVATENYGLLLTYITIVSVSLLITVFYNEERYLFILALSGSAVNLAAASLMVKPTHEYYLQTLLFLLMHIFIHTILLAFAIRKEDPKKEHANQREYALMFGLTYAFLALPLSFIAFTEFRDLSPMIMLALGSWTFLSYAFIDRLEFTKVNYTVSAIGAWALSMAIYWQFDSSLQVVMLYVFGLVGLIVGRIQERAELRVWGLVVLMLGIVTTLGVHYEYLYPTLFVSEKFGLEILGLGTLIVAYYIFPQKGLTEFENNIHDAVQYVIAILLWFFVSWDLVNYFGRYDQVNQSNLSLSIWWIIYAVVLAVASGVLNLKPLRKLALFLFGLVIVKVFLYDLQSLETVYRIISFISLGAILLVVSFVYQNNKEQIKKYLE